MCDVCLVERLGMIVMIILVMVVVDCGNGGRNDCVGSSSCRMI